MDESTQQNAALVEEAAAASKSIEAQAGTLVAQISFFANHGVQPAPIAAKPAAASQAGKGAKGLRVAASANAPRPAAKAPPKPVLAPVPLSRASGDDSTWQEF